MKELINFIKEKQKEYNQDSSAYKVLRELEVIIPSMFKDDSQSQKAKVWEDACLTQRIWCAEEISHSELSDEVRRATKPANPYS